MAGDKALGLNQLRRLTAAPEDDATLLERFRSRTDADAFAELVRRYGPLVRGVCRRVLGDGADADDAFQAAFLVLARKADAVRTGKSVAGWLFAVARFVALRARDENRRRRAHETRATHAPREPGADPELLAAVDEELERLPGRYREPLVACFLRGRTQPEAARELGYSLSTLRRRLEQGQELLRRRLTGRGAVPALGAVATALGGATVSATAVGATTTFVVAAVAGNGGTAPATTLAEGVLAMMARTKLKRLLAAGLVAASLVGGGVAWQLTAAQPPQPVGPGQPADPKPAAPPMRPPVPKERANPGDTIKPGDRFTIRGKELFDQAPLDDIYEIDADGNISLGAPYGGRVKIDGLALADAEAAIRAQVRMYARRGEVRLIRFTPAGQTELEQRVRRLEKEVKELRGLVDELRNK
jgi:RNA polymerase sigma factor (sigma-70 family)